MFMKNRVGQAAAQDNRGVELEAEVSDFCRGRASYLREGEDAEGRLDWMTPNLTLASYLPAHLGMEAGGYPGDVGYVNL